MNWNSTDRNPAHDEVVEAQDEQVAVQQIRYPFVSDSQNENMTIEKLQRVSSELLSRLFKR